MDFSTIPVYVISVKSFAERQSSIEKQAEAFGFYPEFIFQFDADQLSANDLARTSEQLPLKTASCVLKHFEAQKRLLESSSDFALVIEDDVLFFDSFLERIDGILMRLSALKPGWLVFLGGADDSFPNEALSLSRDDLVEQPISTAEAYFIDREGCKLRLAYLYENQILKPADHQLKMLDQLLGIQQFWLAKPLCTQGSITGQFHSSLDSSRSRHSGLYLKIRFEWRRFVKQTVPRAWFLCSRKIRNLTDYVFKGENFD